MRKIKRADYQQIHLLPPTLEDYLPAKHPARFLRQYVESQRVELVQPNPEEGGECYGPELLLSVWLYGYWRNIRSTRKLEHACREELGFMWLSGLHRPDHHALWRFWDQNQKAVGQMFKTTVKVALKLGLADLALTAIDGTKLQAQVSKHGSFDQGHQGKLEQRLNQRIAELERQIAQAAEGHQERVLELSQELANAQGLKEKVQAALQIIEEEETPYVHPQDLEARRMKSEGPNRFSYNAQTVVDAKNQIVLAAEVTNQANDSAQLMPMLEAAQANCEQQKAQCTLADSGYSTAAQIAQVQEAGLEVLSPLSLRVEGQDQPYHSSQFQYEPDTDSVRCPQGQRLKFHHQRRRSGLTVRVYRHHQACARCPVRSLCTTDRHGRSIDVGPHAEALARHRQKMRDPQRRELLKQRASIVEPVFGSVKELGGFRRVSFRGLRKVSAQWQWVCAVWNLRKIYQALCQPRTADPRNQALDSSLAALANLFFRLPRPPWLWAA